MTGAFGMNFGFLNLASAVGSYAFVLALFPGSDLTWPLITAGACTSLLCFVYGQLVASMPRSGGDYVFGSRVIHPIFGALIGGALIVLFFQNSGTYAAFASEHFISYAFNTIGEVLHIHGLVTLSTEVTGHTGTIITGCVLVILAAGVATFGIRVTGRLIFYLTIFAALGVLIALFVVLFSSHQAFVAAYNGFAHNPHAYTSVLAAARAEHFVPHTSTSATITAIPFTATLYWGFTYSAFAGGEVKSPRKTTLYSSLLAIGLGTLLFTIGYLALRNTVGFNFFQSSSILSAANPAKLSALFPAPISGQLFATILMHNSVTKLWLALSFILFSFIPFVVWIIIVSRTLFAMSFDRLIPSAVASVKGSHHTPIYAVIIAALGAIGLLCATTLSTGIASAFRNLILIDGFIYFAASITAAVLPWRRPELFGASPPVIRGKWLGVSPIVWIAGGSATFNAIVIYLTLTKHTYSGGYDTTSILVLAGMVLIGPICYTISHFWLKRQGMDTNLALRELPPE